MCGIVGKVSFRGQIDRESFEKQVDRLAHRGPDGSGIECFDGGHVLFGHRRLSIIDLSERGRQPMSNEDGSVWITYNGEIYNYRELRPTLEKAGHRFSSDTDTEVIIHAFEEWGYDCIRRFRGIFAFAIWNDRLKELFLARDHLGVKPLYYHATPTALAFSSEPTAIVEDESFAKAIDENALRDFFAFGYVPDPGCIFSGIRKLPPGHTLRVKDGKSEIQQYWKARYRPEISSFDEAVEAVGSKVAEVARLQSVSDVPVGALLSGGIDSSFLTGLLAESLRGDDRVARTFTIGFDLERSDERGYARKAAEHFESRHFEKELNENLFGRQLKASIEAFDEPFDPNGPMPATFLAEFVRENDTKVVWGGDGGDELFAGYLRYDRFNEYCSNLPAAQRASWKLFGKDHGNRDDETADQFFTYEGIAQGEEISEILALGRASDFFEGYREHYRKHFQPDIPPVAAGQLMDINLYLPGHILCKVDRATMAYGVEARVPLLDPELVDLAFSIDCDVNYRNGERKAVLKKVAESILPPELVSSRKKGFSSPIGRWGDRRFKDWAEKIVREGYLVGNNLVRPDAIRLFRKRKGNKNLRTFWMILTAELWARRWMAGEDVPLYSTAA